MKLSCVKCQTSMGVTSKRNAKKSDKETQSPYLKIFKDYMMRDAHDPEKWTLLMQKKHDKKKKPTMKKSKVDDNSKISNDLTGDESESRRRSLHKRDSEQWKNESGRDQSSHTTTQDTCSRVSCALKRLVSSEHACLICILFAISMIIATALFLLYRSGSCLETQEPTAIPTEKPENILNDQALRKIVIFKDKRRNRGADDFGRGMEDLLSLHSGIDFEPSFRELNGIEDSEVNPSDVSWTHRQGERGQSSDKIKDFYKKLVKIDAKIKRLKNPQFDKRETTKSPNRLKRSLNSHPRSFYYKTRKIDKNIDPKRAKRDRKEPAGFIIENKKLIVKYQPFKKVVPKCSHAPKDHSHALEHQQKHPFYKNTQHLDEILDHYFDRNLPEDVKDPFNLDHLFKQNKVKCKHPIHKQLNQDNDKMKQFNTKMTLNKEVVNKKINAGFPYEKNIKVNIPKPLWNNIGNEDQKHAPVVQYPEHNMKPVYPQVLGMTAKTTDGIEFRLPILIPSTPKPDFKDTYKISLLDRVPNLRRLKQVDNEEDYSLGYEDTKEVLNDNTEDVDDNENRKDRRKRMQEKSNVLANYLKQKSHNIQNVNWKGPMPLYSDEVNTMISKAEDTKPKIKPEKSHSKQDTQGTEEEISDMDYLQEYLNNKNDKLVDAAQAYSDYGVLEGKKEAGKHDKNTGTDIIDTDHKAKFSLNEENTKEVNRIRKEQHANNYGFTQPPGKYKQNIITDDTDDEFAVTDVLQKEINLGTTTETSPTKQNYFTLVLTCPKLIQGLKKEEITHYKSMYSINNEETSNGYLTIGRRANAPLEHNTELNEVIDTTKLTELLAKKYEKYMHYTEPMFGDLKNMDRKVSAKYPSISIDTTTTDSRIKEFEKPFGLNLPLAMKVFKYHEDLKDVPLLPKLKESQTEDVNVNNINKDDEIIINDIKKFKDKKPRVKRFEKNTVDVYLNNKKIPNDSSPDNNSCSWHSMSKKDFFQMINDWLNKLDGCKNKSKTRSSDNLGEIIDTTLSQDDEEFIESVRHRSRSLLALDLTVNVSVTMPTEIIGLTTDNIQKRKNASNITLKPINNLQKLSITTEEDSNIKLDEMNKDGKHNSAISKRNVDDSNLIFWNDIYDEEYGIQSDPHDTVRDTMKQSDFIGRSGRWVHDKIKKLKDNFKSNEGFDNGEKQRNPRSVFNDLPTNKYYNNDGADFGNRYALDKNQEGFADVEQKKLFTVLTKNMKEVCKKAARAVQQTKNVAVREDTQKDSETATLMQQLITLLSDLVNYQVQEQICTSLPSDLQSFLEWLTEGQSHTAEKKPQDDIGFLPKTTNFGTVEQVTKTATPKQFTMLNTKSTVWETLQDVKGLLGEYDEMSEDEKTRLSGAKAHLHKHLSYLNKKLLELDSDSNVPQKRNGMFYRYKRSHPKHRQRRKSRSFAKKHTSTTDSFHDAVNATDEKKITLEKNKNVIEKRNLKDVYYKAVNDAKKMASDKSLVCSTTKQIVK